MVTEDGGTTTRVQPGDRLILQMPAGYPMAEMVEAAARAKQLTATGGVMVTAPDVAVFVVPAEVDPLDVEVRADDDGELTYADGLRVAFEVAATVCSGQGDHAARLREDAAAHGVQL